jgi:hypothetical protein
MVFDSKTLEKDFFNGLSEYKKYIKKNSFDAILDLNINFYKSIKFKKNIDQYNSVNPNLKISFHQN